MEQLFESINIIDLKEFRIIFRTLLKIEIISDFTDKVGVKYEKYPHTTCPEANGRNSAPGTRASCNSDLKCYAYVDHGNGRGSRCKGITKADPPMNFEEIPNSKHTLFIKAQKIKNVS